MNEYTIVLPGQEILSLVCGTNDRNLKLIEEHLGVPVFTIGNEISIETEDVSVRENFKFIIDRMIDEISDGEKNSDDIKKMIDDPKFQFNKVHLINDQRIVSIMQSPIVFTVADIKAKMPWLFNFMEAQFSFFRKIGKKIKK